MELQPLRLSETLGFRMEPCGHSFTRVREAWEDFAIEFRNNNISHQTRTFVEQFSGKHSSSGTHQRKPISVVVYSTPVQLQVIQEPFIIPVTGKPFDTHNDAIDAWLRVGGIPLLIVREGIDPSHVEMFFDRNTIIS